MRDPEILLLDEGEHRSKLFSINLEADLRILFLPKATAALDSAAEDAVNTAIDGVMRSHNITVILVAHRLSSIARADRVVVLEAGKVTEEGLYRDLSVRDGSRFRSLMAAQLLLEKKRGSPTPAEEANKEAESQAAVERRAASSTA